MPKTNETLNSELHDLLLTKEFEVDTLDSSGDSVPVPEDADVFQFHYHHNGKDYGTVTLTVDGLKNLIVYYNDSVVKDDDNGWFDFMKQLKRFAHRRQLGFKLKDIDRLRTDMKKREHTEKTNEGIERIVDTSLNLMEEISRLDELSTEKLAKYKAAAGKQASELDKEAFGGAKDAKAKIAKANKRFRGIVRATIKQSDNDSKKTKDKKRVDEGYYGNKHTSWSDNTPQIRMIIKHNKRIEEGDQRFRHIERIFLENQLGERVAVPTRKPSVGRAFARHLAEGGKYNDERWNHIAQLSEDVDNLGGFIRATRNGQFNESIQRAITESAEHYANMRESLKRLQTARGYHNYFESWTPTLMECGDTMPDLGSAFTQSRLDPRIERALPLLGRLQITIIRPQEEQELQSWADGLVDTAVMNSDYRQELEEDDQPELRGSREELLGLVGPDSEELPVGPDAMDAIGMLDDLIDSAQLNKRLRDLAEVDPDQDARDTIRAWMREQPEGSVFSDIVDELEAAEPGEYQPKQAEPAKPKKKPAAQPAAPAPDLGLPPLPTGGGAAPAPASAGGLPPPLPLSENDELRALLRLLKV